MQINSSGVEIESASGMNVYGDWVRFKDYEGTTIKIPPNVIQQLYNFAMANKDAFNSEAWE